MQPKASKQRFIPYRKADIVEMCCDDGHFREPQAAQFRELGSLLSSIFHFRFHRTLEILKDCYAPVNPDADTKTVFPRTDEDIEALGNRLTTELRGLLEAANFEAITREDLETAMKEESLFQIRLHVDFDDFEEALFFRRGESVREETLVRWFGLVKRPIRFINYDRVVVYVKFRDRAYFERKDRGERFFTPGTTLIKLFRNIPRSDLEMLFPNSEIRMKPIDKLIIGVPAAIGGVVMLATRLGTTLILVGALLGFWLGMRAEPVMLDQTALLALAAGFGTLGAFLWKQFNKFKNRKIRFMKTLTENLYFKNLDNNSGVFHRLVDAAEEEEFKEAILAFYFLHRAGNPVSAAELDRSIEDWFRENHGHSLDFEISDALVKLEELELVEASGEKYSPLALEKARDRLARRWGGYFEPAATSSTG